MTNRQKVIQHGEQMGSALTLIMCSVGGLFIYLVVQAATTIVTVMALGLFIYMFGGFFMETSGRFGSRFIKELFRICDTRNRVHAMEEYHEIEYNVIPEKRLYLKQGETCELTIKKIAAT